jgi:lipopolysaccharide transport system ATP-binding protein
MSDIAVRVERLGKFYRLGTKRAAGESSLREALARVLSTPFRALRTSSPATRRNVSDYVWALRNVSFEVPRGQILGIIGPNGAGKSTLLKILSRIVEPTEGRAEIHGKVGSLLEVGTGFHPELTGRENIYLSGALLGMRKAEIDRKLDEIVAFAEIEKFIETPVKRYSSGMYVRLAFAVAAHLEPDILIIDEVLAVGDAAFQRKCLSKMEDVRQHGRTVLFVSHNTSAVTRLCQRAILISDGAILKDGPAAHVASAYLLANLSTTAERVWSDAATAPGNDIVRLRSVRVRTEEGVTTDNVDIRRPVGIEMVYDVLEPAPPLVPYYQFANEAGLCIFGAQDLDPEWRRRSRPTGQFTSVAWIPGNLLAEGVIVLTVSIFSADPYISFVYERDAIAFHVVDSVAGDSARGDVGGPLLGVVRPLLNWTTAFSKT